MMRIQDVMSNKVVSVAPTTKVAAAKEKLASDGINHLVVIAGERVVGLVSSRDIVEEGDNRLVSDVMSTNVATIEPEATLRRAAGIMRGRAVGSLPVIDDGRLVGIVTTSDLLTALAKGEIHAAPQRERVVLRKRGPRKRSIPV